MTSFPFLSFQYSNLCLYHPGAGTLHLLQTPPIISAHPLFQALLSHPAPQTTTLQRRVQGAPSSSHLILWGSSHASTWDARGTYGTHTSGPKVSVLGGGVTKFPSLPSLGWIDRRHFYMVPQVAPLAGSPSCPQWQPTRQHALGLALLPPCSPLPSSPLLFFKITSHSELPARKLRLRAPLSGSTQAKPAS